MIEETERQILAIEAEKAMCENPAKKDGSRSINCDQVHWLLQAIDRVIPPSPDQRVSRQREMRKFACLYEIMEVAELKFADKSARWNGTPNDARDYDNK